MKTSQPFDIDAAYVALHLPFFRSMFFFVICFLIFSCGVLTSCNKQAQNCLNYADKVISVDINNVSSLLLSELFDTLEYVPLETSDEALFSFPEHLKITKQGDVYFLSNKSFYLFDGNSGKCKMKLFKLGGGPGEYQSIFDSYVNEANSEIEILDNNGKKVLIYDKDGNYLRNIALNFSPFSMTKTNDSIYWFYNNNLISDVSDCKLVCYNSKGSKIIGEFFPIDKHLAEFFFVSDERNVAFDGKELFYMASPVDTIYSIDLKEKKQKVAYCLDLHSNRIPSSFLGQNFTDIVEFSQKASKRGYIYAFPTFAFNGRIVITAYRKDKDLFMNFYDRELHQAYTINQITDDFHFETPFRLEGINLYFTLYNDVFYFVMSSEQFLKMKPKDGVQTDIQKILRQYELTEFSNPVLVKCKLKFD